MLAGHGICAAYRSVMGTESIMYSTFPGSTAVLCVGRLHGTGSLVRSLDDVSTKVVHGPGADSCRFVPTKEFVHAL